MADFMSTQPLPSNESTATGSSDTFQRFEEFVRANEPQLRRAFVAAYGGDRGREATAEALAYAWEHWHQISQMTNAPGYLYRVGQSRTRQRRSILLFVSPSGVESAFEPELIPALKRLTVNQRTAVVLILGYGWTFREVAELTSIKVTTVQNHLERGLKKLRRELNGDIK
jgi:DNA-directed RNA polymerase specialized sigma24 family protein